MKDMVIVVRLASPSRLLYLILVLLALRDCSAYEHEAGVVHGNMLIEGRENVATFEKELIVEVATEKMMMGGRKMKVDESFRKDMLDKDLKREEKASKFSGAIHCARKCNEFREVKNLNNGARFLANTADYNHNPRHHPPRNN